VSVNFEEFLSCEVPVSLIDETSGQRCTGEDHSYRHAITESGRLHISTETFPD
jgi:hypothetical protein